MKKTVKIKIKDYLLKTQLSTGEKRTITDVARSHDVTAITIDNYEKEAPKSVKFVYDFMKETGCTFEDIVKEE